MASFQVKIGWKRMKKRLKKKLLFRSVPTQPITENSKKITKKLRKQKKYHYRIISSKNRLEKAEKERK